MQLFRDSTPLLTAVLAVNILNDASPRTAVALQRQLHKIPKGLTAIYAHLLEEVNKEEEQDAIRSPLKASSTLTGE